jgi:hypothetical protein
MDAGGRSAGRSARSGNTSSYPRAVTHCIAQFTSAISNRAPMATLAPTEPTCDGVDSKTRLDARSTRGLFGAPLGAYAGAR